jgi:hypothetical protein
MEWAVYVVRVGRQEMYTRVSLENFSAGDNIGDLSLEGRIILKYMLEVVSFAESAYETDPFLLKTGSMMHGNIS